MIAMSGLFYTYWLSRRKLASHEDGLLRGVCDTLLR
jgi:hypothetical protein